MKLKHNSNKFQEILPQTPLTTMTIMMLIKSTLLERMYSNQIPQINISITNYVLPPIVVLSNFYNFYVKTTTKKGKISYAVNQEKLVNIIS